jgi:hypothetical protein
MEIKKLDKGSINQPNANNELTCLFCGSHKNLSMYAHREKGKLCGFIYSCCEIPPDHRLILIPASSMTDIMISKDIFNVLVSNIAFQVARHGHKSSGFDTDTEDEPDASDFYYAIEDLRKSKIK